MVVSASKRPKTIHNVLFIIAFNNAKRLEPEILSAASTLTTAWRKNVRWIRRLMKPSDAGECAIEQLGSVILRVETERKSASDGNI